MQQTLSIQQTESRAIAIGAIANLVMALAAWYTYYRSNSEAILLDGNYSFILFLGMLTALRVARIKSLRSQTFPLGQYFYEALYALSKGLMLLGVVTMAAVTSVVRIVLYHTGGSESIPRLDPQPILAYAIGVALICFGLYAYLRAANARIHNQSTILFADAKASLTDGTLSVGIAVGVFFLAGTATDSAGTAWIPYLADSVITLILAAILIREPLTIIRTSIIELAGGTLQDTHTRQVFRSAVASAVQNKFEVADLYLSKTGSRYMLVAYLKAEGEVPMERLLEVRRHIEQRLRPEYPHLHLELILTPASALASNPESTAIAPLEARHSPSTGSFVVRGHWIFRALMVVLGGLAILLLAGFLWLRQSPYWAGITLFSEHARIENFRSMDRVFDAHAVANGQDVWAFQNDPRPLPEHYVFAGETRRLADLMDRTQTTGLLVLHQDAITHETYHLGADEHALLTSWSVAKSVLSALIGIALDEGHIASLDDPVKAYVSGLAGSAYGSVSIEHLLTMSSGIAFNEEYNQPFSDINLLFLRTMAMRQPQEQILSGLPRWREPGTFNHYISSDSMVLGLVLEGATGMPLADYLSTRLWQPMGAEAPATWSVDRHGQAFAFCCLNARLRDYARLGRLYMNEGRRDSLTIVPPGWVQASTQPTAPHLLPGDNPHSSWTFGYGYQWWIPEDPQGDFAAIGIWGQYIYVDPTRQVVIVKTSADPDFDENDHETIAAFRAIAHAVHP